MIHVATRSYSNGLAKLKLGVIIYLVYAIASIIGGFAVLVPPFLTGSFLVPSTLTPVLRASTLNIVLKAIGLVIILFAFWYLYNGFKSLKASRFPNDAGRTGIIGVTIQVIGVVISFVSVILTGFAAGTVAELGVAAAGGIIAFVGAIFTMLAFYKVGSNYNSTIVKVGGILFLLINFVGDILLFIGLDEITKKR